VPGARCNRRGFSEEKQVLLPLPSRKVPKSFGHWDFSAFAGSEKFKILNAYSSVKWPKTGNFTAISPSRELQSISFEPLQHQ